MLLVDALLPLLPYALDLLIKCVAPLLIDACAQLPSFSFCGLLPAPVVTAMLPIQLAVELELMLKLHLQLVHLHRLHLLVQHRVFA